jgi:drug/metabolite transporter (DMT)-like permease
MGEFITFSIAGLIIIFFSYLIKYKKQAYLISGYNEDEIIDKDGFCNWIGGVMMWPGIFAIIAGALMWMYPAMGMPVALAFALITIVAVIIAIVGGRKYKKDRD